MRQIMKDFVRICSETLPLLEPIYEFGAIQVPGQEVFADLREFFRGKEYVGCDIAEDPGVDRILDLQNINLPPESVGTIIIIDTLEHVELFKRAIGEGYRVLKPSGIVIIGTTMNYPIHNYPHDYWRFTPEGMKSLLKIFNTTFVDYVGQLTLPHTIIGIGVKGNLMVSFDEFRRQICSWKTVYKLTPIGNLKDFRKLFIPPTILELSRIVRDFLRYFYDKGKNFR